MNRDLENKYRSVIENNENVGKISDGKEFLILVSGFVLFCFLIFACANILVSFYIDIMPQSTRENVENVLGSMYSGCDTDGLENIEKIKNKIIKTDPSRLKTNLAVCRYSTKEINAFVVPSGKIYLTSGLIKEVQDEEMLAFVLAHEMGHYANRDHLKTIGREVVAFVVMSALFSNQKDITKTFSGISNINRLNYSRKQEKAADIYANKAVMNIYGRNTGAVKILNLLEEKSDIPEFMYYFSTHPKTKERIKLLSNY